VSVISIRNLEKRYEDEVILTNVNADIEAGEVISIIGPSGAGKSTFLRAINHLDPPTSGEIYFDGELITPQNKVAVRRRMGMVFQDFGLFSHMTALENVVAGPIRLLKMPKAEAEQRGTELLDQVGLGHRTTYYPYQLSGGQQQRVAIARCLAMNPEVILFDEPTSALDPTMTGEVLSVIRSLTRSGLTMLVVTQEMDFARSVSSRVFYMDEHGIYEEGPPDLIFTNPTREKTKAFIHQITSYNFEVESDRFDFVAMLHGIESFCFGNGFDKALANRIQLVAEELMINLVIPRFGSANLNLSVAQDTGSAELRVSYPGPPVDALSDAADDLSAVLVRNAAQEVSHYYVADQNILELKISGTDSTEESS